MHSSEGTAARVLHFSPASRYRDSRRSPFPCPALTLVAEGQTEGQTQARGTPCSRHLSDKAEPQQMTGMSEFANEAKAVPRTSPIIQGPQLPSPWLCVDWMQDFIRTLKLRSCKITVQKTNYTYFCNSQFKLVFRSPHIPLRYIKHFFHLKCSFIKAILLNLIDA